MHSVSSNVPPITLIGAGGIGSLLAQDLARSRFPRVEIWDDDVVETSNLACQGYGSGDVGKPKVKALTTNLYAAFRVRFTPIQRRFTAADDPQGIVIAAVDDMYERTAIWKAVRGNASVTLFLDGRLGPHSGRVYVISPTNPREIAYYERMLYPDPASVERLCDQTGALPALRLITGFMHGQLRMYLEGHPITPEFIFDLPSQACILNSRTIITQTIGREGES